MRSILTVLAATSFCLASGHAALAAEPGVRVEVVIKQIVLPDGTPRYTIPVTVGGTVVEASLDSGSTGLRILPGTLPEGSFTPTSRTEVYSYGSGAEYKGVIANAPMEIGGLTSKGAIPFQAIQTVGCTVNKPRCPVSRVSAKAYGIAGNGIAGQGFRAIVGVNMANAPAANPLYGIGVKTWIIILPRPGEATGKLILNPSDQDMDGYARMTVQPRFSQSAGGLHDAVWGCLTNGRTKADFCGPFLLDTGGDGLAVSVGQRESDSPWGPGIPVIMSIGSETRQPFKAEFTTGQSSASKLHINPGQGQPNSRIMAGPLPYFAFQALYDSKAGTVGLKPR